MVKRQTTKDKNADATDGETLTADAAASDQIELGPIGDPRDLPVPANGHAMVNVETPLMNGEASKHNERDQDGTDAAIRSRHSKPSGTCSQLPPTENWVAARQTGVMQQVGIFYALGFALACQGLFSTCYHICPSNTTLQFDTTIMHLIVVLSLIKLFQVKLNLADFYFVKRIRYFRRQAVISHFNPLIGSLVQQ